MVEKLFFFLFVFRCCFALGGAPDAYLCLHVPAGDVGNTGATIQGPCMFDPASFFGHSEFELSIMEMFGGFEKPFWDAYHAKVRAFSVCHGPAGCGMPRDGI